MTVSLEQQIEHAAERLETLKAKRDQLVAKEQEKTGAYVFKQLQVDNFSDAKLKLDRLLAGTK
ncbi:hypothetical protein [Furfurilactobacillus entadae]|uniref:hypothetical protein n=1 Tax=Furfurilactobacillus entadae TaxID=2922307 RepID=UPI0035E66CAC